MEISRGLESFPDLEARRILAVGTFDGVHLGHQAIVREVMRHAEADRSPSAALTFDPHPQRFLAKDAPPLLLTPSEEKAELLSKMGLDHLLILPFNRDLASMEAEEFVRDILFRKLRVGHVVVGFSHRFGRGRRGDPSLLAKLGRVLGFGVTVVEPVLLKGGVVNATRIRQVLRRGEVEVASELLGRQYSLSGTVVPGEKRGAVLSFPTANIEVRPEEKLVPKEGVYAVQSDLQGGRVGGMMNVGVRPTFGGGRVAVEVHLFDFKGDLYGRAIRVSFAKRLRAELRFESLEELRHQMEQDEERARQILKGS